MFSMYTSAANDFGEPLKRQPVGIDPGKIVEKELDIQIDHGVVGSSDPLAHPRSLTSGRSLSALSQERRHAGQTLFQYVGGVGVADARRAFGLEHAAGCEQHAGGFEQVPGEVR